MVNPFFWYYSMRLILVRHAQPDYNICRKRGFIGLGINLAPLTDEGCKQADIMSKNAIFHDADAVVSSPYTRAIQTASYISIEHGLPLKVEVDLQEWIPDLTYKNSIDDEIELSNEFLKNGGHWPNSPQKWEPLDQFSNRITQTLDKYISYNKIVAVCHGAIIYHLTNICSVPYCGIIEIDYHLGYIPKGTFKKKL